jgi:hypothetical protein
VFSRQFKIAGRLHVKIARYWRDGHLDNAAVLEIFRVEFVWRAIDTDACSVNRPIRDRLTNPHQCAARFTPQNHNSSLDSFTSDNKTIVHVGVDATKTPTTAVVMYFTMNVCRPTIYGIVIVIGASRATIQAVSRIAAIGAVSSYWRCAMKTLIQDAAQTAERVKEQISKIKDRYQYGQVEYDMADDALLGVKWAMKRLKDLETTVVATPKNQP